MKAPDCIVIDFETLPIQQRPDYPPEPVGVAIKWPREASVYHAWGHPTANTCSRDYAHMSLRRAYSSGLPILFHHGKFDMAVAEERLGLPPLPWQRAHDTMFLSFLKDPHNDSLKLKDLAADFLKWPPDEQDELHDWIWVHRVELEATYNLEATYGMRITKKNLGAWIAYAPGDLVGRYACGDVDRTEGLFQHLYPMIQADGMGTAYDRERRLVPLFMENERIGMRTAMRNLERDIGVYDDAMLRVEEWLRIRLGVENFDADREVADALLKRGIVPAENWTMTKSGQLSVSKDNLYPEMFTGDGGAEVASALGYRNRLKTCLEMFMKPWLAQAVRNNGYITTNWNQTRGYEGGTRSGRPSTNHHNFLNLSKKWDGRDDGYEHPAFLGVATLPLVRRYILPDEGGVFLHRDFDGQEMRVFADVECGALKHQYTADPKLDPHAFVGAELTRVTGRDFTSNDTRTKVKTLNFQGLYGGGVPALQRKLRGISLAEAKELKSFHNKALPGRQVVVDAIKALVNRGEPIRTWGGRVYYCEPAKLVDGRMRTMDYKLINYVCQGSAADLTKEALAQWYEGGAKARFLVTVYDEINLSAPIALVDEEMAWLREVMERPRLDIAMLSSGKRGPSWGELEKCE